MNTNNERRFFLKSSLATGMVGSAIGLGLLTPRAVLAAWSEGAFSADTIDKALESAMGTTAHTASDAIKLETPEVAENGSVVPITVKTSMTGVESIAMFADKNARPLTVVYRPGERGRSGVAVRIKMGASGNIIAVVKTKDGKLHSAQNAVTVKAGGC
jgi:sulfur-oxidizing protein SoxY